MADGSTMPLAGHLRELRMRLIKACAAILVATIGAFTVNERLLGLLTHPFHAIEPQLRAKGIDTSLVMTGVGGPFQFQLKIALVAGILMASPIWLWQLWAFVLPALHRNERRWAVALTATGVPLFVGGATLAYFLLPKAFVVLLGFVPKGWGSLLTAADYYDFIIRMLLVFGVAAEIPLVVVLLNRIGAVNSRQLAAARPWTVVGIFVFAAVATPTTDPLTMLFLAVPMTVLYLAAEFIARVTDRKRAVAEPQWSDDELSPLD